MKTLSVSALKNTYTGISRAYPEEGTFRAEILNKLKRLPGVWVHLEPGNSRNSVLRVLRDEYGMNIEKNPQVKNEYRIVGEWFGGEYISYIDRN
jgi:hypothetical protein